ncbi:MAG: hypothetical protein HS113_02480 [Verrucomicrobiales bacterium]|nr:hypothetical protein [Verrucomicrobiales bacterium]
MPEPVGGALPPAVAFVELATGLNRWEETSQRWVPAQAEWEQTSEGYFIARKTAHRVILTPNLNTVGAAQVLAPDGVRLRATPLALAYRDARTSESVVLATIQDCRGVWVSATEVEYPQAFAGTAATVLYRLDRDRFEQEVILQERLPRPEELGLEPASTWLVVISEFYEVSAPVPVASDSTAGSGQDWLSFGVMALAPGKAFLLDEDAEETVPVLKHWETADGRSFLVEAVDYTAVRALLEGLPEPDQARARAPRTRGGRVAGGWPIRPTEHETRSGVPRFEEGRLVVDEVHWADRGQGSGDRLDLAGPGSRGATEPPRFAQADPHRGGERRGVVLDYLLLTSQSNLTLQGDTTYYVTGTVNVQHLTVEGGAVVKYDTPATARVSVSSSVTCRTGPYRPAFFTHKYDNTVGETVATGDPSASYVGYPLLELAGSSGASLEHLRFRHAQTALKVHGASGATLTCRVRHSQFVRCATAWLTYGVSSSYPVRLEAGNLLMVNVGTAFGGYLYTGTVEHLTVDGASVLATASSYYGPGALALTNSILAGVTTLMGQAVSLNGSYNGFWNCPSFGSYQRIAQTPPFWTIAAGAHYLAGAEFVNEGTFAVSPSLRDELRRMTTRGPTEITSLAELPSLNGLIGQAPWIRADEITSLAPFLNWDFDKVLVPQELIEGQTGHRDGDVPDLGYHYAPLDYCWTGLTLERVLVLAKGVAIGLYGAHGLDLGPAARLISCGLPHTPNQLVRLQAVQEMAAAPYTDQSLLMTLLRVGQVASPAPEIVLRFSEVSLSGAGTERRYVLEANQATWCQPSYPLGKLAVSDCRLWGAKLWLQPGYSGLQLALTNNLWGRAYLYFDQKYYCGTATFPCCFFNNLVYGGLFAAYYGDPATSWVLKDNLFDRCTFSVYGQATDNSHNAYHQVGARMPGAHDDITLTSVNYLTGPHGFHYYPNSGTTGLRALVNAGSTSAGARDLYFFTTHENQAPEGTTILDIGYHYPPAVPFLTVTTNLIGAVDLGYHPGNQSLIVSVNFHNGLPINFRRVASNGGVSDWSSASGYGFEVPSECAQTTSGVFTMGETFLGEHPYFPSVPARIWRISPTGTLDGSPWVELRESTGNPPRAEYDFKPQSLCLDTTGVFGGDLLVATGWLETDTGGNVWRVNRSNKSVTLLAALTDCLEGLMVCPNNPSKYGSTLAGKLLVGAGTRRLLHVIGPQGGHSSTDLGITIFDLHTVAPAQSLYCLEFRYKAGTVNWPDHYTGQSRLLKVSPEFFSNIAGDILLVRSGEATPVAYSPDGALFLLRWDGTRYVSLQVSDDLPRILEHAVFAPVSLPATP